MELGEYDWVDVSLPLSNGLPAWPGDEPFRLDTVAGEGGLYIISRVSMSLHGGTHLDAPLHYLEEGSPVDAASPRVLIGRAKVVEISPGGGHILTRDLLPSRPARGERLLIKAGNSPLYAKGSFCRDFRALTPEAASFLADCGVSLVGIDYFSVEPWGGDGSVHRTLAEAGIWVLEGLDWGKVEPGEYFLVCLPLRIKGAEASPARAFLGKPAVGGLP
jgi:arylformamidase